MQLVTQPVKKINSEVELQITPMYLTPQDDYVPPLPSKDCVAIRHPGQVPQSGTRAGIQTTSPRRRGTRHQMTLLNFHWIPDLARLRRTRPE